MKELHELSQKRTEVKHELMEIENQMANYVMRWEGTLAEAIGAGLVRFNFAVPRGLLRHIKQEYNDIK